MLVMDLFPIYLTENHYFCFYFFTLAFYFVPSLENLPAEFSDPLDSDALDLSLAPKLSLCAESTPTASEVTICLQVACNSGTQDPVL